MYILIICSRVALHKRRHRYQQNKQCLAIARRIRSCKKQKIDGNRISKSAIALFKICSKSQPYAKCLDLLNFDDKVFVFM